MIDTQIKFTTIVQLVPNMQSGGVEQGVIDMNQAIIAHGWRSIVISNGGRLVQQIEKAGGIHIKLPLHLKNPFSVFMNQRALSKIYKNYNVSLVHARSRAPAWAGLKPARKLNIPFVTTIHGAYGAANIFKKLYNQIMLKGDRIIAVSHFIVEYLHKNYKVDARKVRVIPRGIDAQFLDRNSIPKSQIETLINLWQLPEDKRIIMLPARLTRAKGHLLLLEAFKKLNDPTLFLLFVGEGKEHYKQEIFQHIVKLQLENNVKLVGHCADMPAAYFLSEIVVLPVLAPESFGRVAVEAMAMGCLTIASDIGGTSETILDQETGFLVQHDDIKSLKKCLEHVVLLNKNEIRCIQEKAHTHVLMHYTKEMMTSKTIEVYEELL
ncbi:MAG: glycosyltransferase family 4 protein [Alphaproteobacteria bacterium]|nr:glycosyltransferase family 4 protein [Alphaproteobacteria bacterium]